MKDFLCSMTGYFPCGATIMAGNYSKDEKISKRQQVWKTFFVVWLATFLVEPKFLSKLNDSLGFSHTTSPPMVHTPSSSPPCLLDSHFQYTLLCPVEWLVEHCPHLQNIISFITSSNEHLISGILHRELDITRIGLQFKTGVKYFTWKVPVIKHCLTL